MYNLKINFAKVIQENLSRFLRAPRRLKYLYAARKPFRILYSEFQAKMADLKYRATYNGQVIYLEGSLNDKFDPVLRRIYIEDHSVNRVYWYRKAEIKPAPILYRRWKSTISFNAGQFCFNPVDKLIYESNTTPNLNKVPGVDPEWDLTARQAPILYRRSDFNGGIGFHVMVPTGLVYDASEMHKHIKYYKLAGPGYIIKTF